MELSSRGFLVGGARAKLPMEGAAGIPRKRDRNVGETRWEEVDGKPKGSPRMESGEENAPLAVAAKATVRGEVGKIDCFGFRVQVNRPWFRAVVWTKNPYELHGTERTSEGTGWRRCSSPEPLCGMPFPPERNCSTMQSRYSD